MSCRLMDATGDPKTGKGAVILLLMLEEVEALHNVTKATEMRTDSMMRALTICLSHRLRGPPLRSKTEALQKA